MVATGVVRLGGMQSGGTRVLEAVDWARATQYLASEMPYPAEVSGTVSIDTTTGSITGTGSLDVLIDGTQRIAIVEGDFALNASSGRVTGDVAAGVPLGDYGKVGLSSLQDVSVDVATGEIHARGQATLTPVPGVSTVLSGTFVVQPKAFKLAYAGQLDLEAGSVTIPLRGVEAEIDFTNGYFSGRSSSVEIPNIGTIVETSTPQAEFVLDASEGRLKFSIDTGVSSSLTLGNITLSLGTGGPGFAFEINLSTGYFYLQVSSIDLGAGSINNVEIEIDPSGNILFEPEYTVPGYLSDPFYGQIRFAGDVSIMIPVANDGDEGGAWPEDEREPEQTASQSEKAVGLMLNVKGEQVIRVPDGDGFLWATNATLGIELSAGVATLGIEMGGTTSVYALGGDDPLLAIGLGVEGLALKDLGLSMPDALGNIALQPGQTAVFVYHLADQQLEGAGIYTYLGLEVTGQFTVTASTGMTVSGQLDVPLGGVHVGVTGALDWEGNLLVTGTGDLTWLGLTMASAGFTLDNDGLYVNGTVTIPAVGAAAVAGSVASDGTFSFSGMANVNPGGLGQMTAAVHWTHTNLTLAGTVQTPVGDATVSGTASASSFLLTGSGSLGLGGFTMAAASVTLDSATGLYAQGAVSVPGAGSVTLSGAIQKNGYFTLTGSGSLVPGGFQLASASFSLTKSAAGTSFQANGSLYLGGATVASASLSIGADGSFSGSGSVNWGGFTISASVSMSSAGAVTLSGSIAVDATYSGYGIEGTLSLSASSSGSVSAEIDFRAKLAGETVFSGTASVSSSGKVKFKACVCGWSWCCASVTIYL
ncbi:MAG: hypothetical protein JXA93_18590, partial [Anaerolineae bacterium]|nr:hypothetical protein [Anaerolineae bacterium]